MDVDSDTFYAVGGRLFELAGEVYDAFAVNVVIQAGYNHGVAEYNATTGQRGEPPQRPPEPASTAGVLSAPPSAGGPGKGLFDDALGLVEQVGVPVPDGDTVKVDTAAQAWDRLATVYQTVTVVEALEVNARAFSDTQSPEVEFITRDLGELRELAQSCTDYQAALDDLRTQLEDIPTELAIELAVTATISKFARTIRSAISAWKISKQISQGVKKAHDIAGVRKRLERIKNLARKSKPEEPKSLPRPRVAIPEGAPKTITGYTRHAEEQIAGRERGIGVSREALEDVFKIPLRDVERVVDPKDRG